MVMAFLNWISGSYIYQGLKMCIASTKYATTLVLGTGLFDLSRFENVYCLYQIWGRTGIGYWVLGASEKIA